MLRKTTLIILLLLFHLYSYAQTATIKGIITDENNQAVPNATITIQGQNLSTKSDQTGVFSISNVPYGNYILEISAEYFAAITKPIQASEPTVDVGSINLSTDETRNDQDNIPTVTLSEEELKESSSQSVSGLLNASRDAFTSAATFGFSIARFRIRGYEDENFITLMNGAPMTDLTRGQTMFYSWSGLNDVMRSRQSVIGLESAEYAYGGVGGSYFIDSRASRQRKQLQVSYSLSNRTYDNRIMATYGTGILKNGWSFALSGSRRWAKEGYISGTFYDGWSYFASAEKQINLQHSISLTAFGAPSKSGRSSPAVQELYDLTGTNYYNPSWGYQNGEKRNAKVARNDLKSFIFTHDWKINSTSSLLTAVSLVTGKSRSSAFDWYNAPNPYPDYYRNIPSFTEDSVLHAQLINLFQTNDSALQVNWHGLYAANALSDTTIEDAEGIEGNSVSGKWARYVMQDYVTDHNIIGLNTTYNKAFNDQIAFSGGASIQKQNTEYYRELTDLLGADFYVNINKYVQQDNPANSVLIQNDLNNPNGIVRVGDRFGYDYVADIQKISGWWQTNFTFDKVDYFIGTQISQTQYFREGKFKNGLFPDNSFGKSETQNFTNFAVKGGATYKINGRNYLFANASVLSRAPLFENVYTSPRTRDDVAPSVKEEKVNSIEGGYLLRAPKMKGRLVGYLTNFNDAIETKTFFNESTNSFGNFTLTNIDKRHVGVEIAFDMNIGNGFSASAVAAVGQYYYNSRPLGTFTEDESALDVISNETIYSKGLKISGSPQAAYTAGISYRSKDFWFVNLNVNYFDNIYIDFSPIRRTMLAVDLIEPDSTLWEDILAQEKVKSQVTIDFFGGYSWRINNKFKTLKRNSFLVINVGVNNILDNKDFITNGYEQLRFDFENKNINKYAPKYFYAFGRTYFINLTLRFN